MAPKKSGATTSERIQKVLSQLGLASRRQAEEWIRAGRITVNGRVAALGDKIARDDHLQLDGRAVRQRAAASAPLFLCNRSPGQALLPRADVSESMAAGLPKRSGRRYLAISPLPEPDGGLELLTADGDLAMQLQRRVRQLAIEFQLRVRGELSEQQLDGIREGQLDRGERLKIDSLEAGGGAGANRWYTVQATGASGNDLRQLLQRQGITVSRILRVALGGLRLDRALARGHSREVSDEELQALMNPVSAAMPTVVDP
jgi:23S rRNA pseudouridine2605 synthase